MWEKKMPKIKLANFQVIKVSAKALNFSSWRKTTNSLEANRLFLLIPAIVMSSFSISLIANADHEVYDAYDNRH